MCWSGEASTVWAAIGVSGTLYAAYKKEPMALWISLGYFSLMEVLQAYTYRVIDQCDDPANQIATLLGYLHICFQPFFVNAVALHFINQERARKVAPFAYALCFAATIMLLIKIYPFSWAGKCTIGRLLCGETLCSIHGNWHIAWLLPFNDILPNVPWYLFVGFILPLAYGSWRLVLYSALSGPMLAYLTTDNMNEWPAVWCLFSIGLLLVAIKTPVRKWLYIKKAR